MLAQNKFLILLLLLLLFHDGTDEAIGKSNYECGGWQNIFNNKFSDEWTVIEKDLADMESLGYILVKKTSYFLGQ